MARIETDRLVLREQTPDDAAFVLTLVNDPDWLRYIGDRGVRTLGDARVYVQNAIGSYRRDGFGLWLVEARGDAAPVGLCGLIKRDSLEDVDLGFAFLPAYRGRGYASEAATAVLDHGWRVLGLRRVVAIVSPDNAASVRVLEGLGFTFDRPVRLPGGDGVSLFARDAPGPGDG